MLLEITCHPFRGCLWMVLSFCYLVQIWRGYSWLGVHCLNCWFCNYFVIHSTCEMSITSLYWGCSFYTQKENSPLNLNSNMWKCWLVKQLVDSFILKSENIFARVPCLACKRNWNCQHILKVLFLFFYSYKTLKYLLFFPY